MTMRMQRQGQETQGTSGHSRSTQSSPRPGMQSVWVQGRGGQGVSRQTTPQSRFTHGIAGHSATTQSSPTPFGMHRASWQTIAKKTSSPNAPQEDAEGFSASTE